MKKVELTSGIKFVLIVLTWLLTFTVTNVTTLVSGAGSLIGALAFYALVLFADFVYFKDCCLQKHAKMSLVAVVILIACKLVVSCYNAGVEYLVIDASAKLLEKLNDVKKILNGLVIIGTNVAVIVCLIMVLVKSNKCCEECSCNCEAQKQVEENSNNNEE